MDELIELFSLDDQEKARSFAQKQHTENSIKMFMDRIRKKAEEGVEAETATSPPQMTIPSLVDAAATDWKVKRTTAVQKLNDMAVSRFGIQTIDKCNDEQLQELNDNIKNEVPF